MFRPNSSKRTTRNGDLEISRVEENEDLVFGKKVVDINFVHIEQIIENEKLRYGAKPESVLVFPSGIYETINSPAPNLLLWNCIYGVSGTKEFPLFTQEMLRISSRNQSRYSNTFEPYAGFYKNIPGYKRKKICVRKVQARDDGTLTATKSAEVDDTPKLVGGLLKEGYVNMYPGVENIQSLADQSNRFSKRLKPRYISMYQISAHSYYVIEVRKTKETHVPHIYIYLEFCKNLKQGEENREKSIEIYVDELVYVIIPAAEEFDDWIQVLSKATGIELDVQSKEIKVINRSNSSLKPSLSNIWTSKSDQLEPYSRENDLKALRAFEQERIELFDIYPHIGSYGKSELKKARIAKHFYVQLSCLSLDMGLKMQSRNNKINVEPYVVRCHLWDLKNNIKLSEDITFDVGDKSILAMCSLEQTNVVSDVITNTTLKIPAFKIVNGVFQLLYGLEDVYIIFYVLKLFDGADSTDYYLKPDIKTAQKQHVTVGEIIKRQHCYYTYMGFAYKKVNFGETPKGIEESLPLYRYESRFEYPQLIKSMLNNTVDHKFKVITFPGSFVNIRYSVLRDLESIPQRMTSNFEPRKSFKMNDDSKTDEGQAALSVETFVEVLPLGFYNRMLDNEFHNTPHNLYIYPSMINLTGCKSSEKVKTFLVEFTFKVGDSGPLPVFYSCQGSVGFVNLINVPINPKSLTFTPNFEIKMLLPKNITPDMHIFINVYSLKMKLLFKDTSKSKESVKSLIGTTWINLSKCINQEQSKCELGLALTPTLVKNYASINMSDSRTADIKYIDGSGKPLIKVNLEYASTLCCLDESFNSLLELLKVKGLTKDVWQEASKLIKISHALNDNAILSGYRVILQIMVNIIIMTKDLSSDASKKICHSAVSLMLQCLKILFKYDYSHEIIIFIENYLEVKIDNTFVHSGFLCVLAKFFTTDYIIIETILDTFNVVAAILKKSFMEMVIPAGKYKKNRTGILPAESQRDMEKVIYGVCHSFLEKYRDKPHRMKELNDELCDFFGFLINTIDRKLVLKLTSIVIEVYKTAESKHGEFSNLRPDFVRNLSMHEFFMYMNLPLLINPKEAAVVSSRAKTDQLMFKMSLTSKFYQEHYFIACMLDIIQKSFMQPLAIRNAAILTLKHLMYKNHYDTRINGDKEVYAQLLHCYTPFLTLMIENLHIMIRRIETSVSSSEAAPGKSTLGHSTSVTSLPFPQRKNSFLRASLGETYDTTQFSVSQGSLGTHNSSKEHRDHFLCALYILQNISKPMLKEWIKEIPRMSFRRPIYVQNTFKEVYGDNCTSAQANLVDFLMLLVTATNVFHNESAKDLKKELVREGLTSSFTSSPGVHRSRKGKNLNVIAEETVNLENAHSEEVVILVMSLLDTFQSICKNILEQKSGNNPVNTMYLLAYTHILEKDYSDYVYKCLLVRLRLLVQENPSWVFKGQNSFNEKLCTLLFKRISMLENSFKRELTIFLYQLLKANYMYTKAPYQRTYIKIICAVTNLIDDPYLPKFISKSVHLWLRLVKDDIGDKAAAFVNEVYDLSRRIQAILRISRLSKNYKDDTELSIDILYNLKTSFSQTPELLISWYSKISEEHVKNGYHSEAAMCSLHAASILMQIMKQNKVIHEGVDSLKKISDNIQLINFMSTQDELIDYDNQSIFALYNELEKCSKLLISAERYESVGLLFKVILPYLENQKAFGHLKEVYNTMSQSYAKIADSAVAGKRNFGSYYKVAFFGPDFREDNGKKYIYKEPPYTQLASIKDRMESLAKQRNIAVTTILDSEKVVLESGKNYIQINVVIPSLIYYDKDDMSGFESNTNIREFVLEKPFTVTGKSHGSVRDQFLRVIKYNTYHAFPYAKKRLHILYKEIIELTPIEVAIKEMSTQARQLQQLTALEPPDMKRLQLKLQGSVSVQVNAGPLAYAEAFLSMDNKTDKPKLISTLREIFELFLSACENALRRNSELIKTDQLQYHEDMMGKFEDLKASLESYLHN